MTAGKRDKRADEKVERQTEALRRERDRNQTGERNLKKGRMKQAREEQGGGGGRIGGGGGRKKPTPDPVRSR